MMRKNRAMDALAEIAAYTRKLRAQEAERRRIARPVCRGGAVIYKGDIVYLLEQMPDVGPDRAEDVYRSAIVSAPLSIR